MTERYQLLSTEQGLALDDTHGEFKPLLIDFESRDFIKRASEASHKQLLAKAIGTKSANYPSVLDCTAGLGRDSYTLASMGCQVTMLERNPILYALLADAMSRAADNAALQKMSLLQSNAIDYLNDNTTIPGVIYLDPMYPERKKSSLVKKEMRILQDVVGRDDDGLELLQLALSKPCQRVVVKRPKHAPTLIDNPHHQIIGKSTRFDVYLPVRSS